MSYLQVKGHFQWVKMDELLSLKWNNHCSTFLHVLCNVRNEQKYADVTLACAGNFYSAHKLVLSSCSDYFAEIFDQTDPKNLVILLKDIKSEELEALLDYMYIGEVNVKQANLASLIKSAECLQIRGLAVADESPVEKTSKSSKKQSKNATDSPIPKKKRKLDEPYNYSNSPPVKKKINQSPAANTDFPDERNMVNEKIKYDTDDIKNIVIKEENDSFPHEVFSIEDDDYFENDLVSQQTRDDPPYQPVYGSSIPVTSDTENPVDNCNYPGPSYNENDSHEWEGDESIANVTPSNISNFDTPALPVKKHQCPICARNFTRADNLRAHLIIHSGVRRFACQFCDYKAYRRDTIVYHAKLKHQIEHPP